MAKTTGAAQPPDKIALKNEEKSMKICSSAPWNANECMVQWQK
jgi:hypothetical protein